MKEQVDDWVNKAGEQRGAILSLAQVWELSKLWYGDRMSPDFRGRSMDDAMRIFDQLGLVTAFWQE